ncbi:MAG: hypothetical protein IK077_10730 [Thermoguttaceae bacterium]|nr:hypothetical protein [Thermoguttaceae bacterium]
MNYSDRNLLVDYLLGRLGSEESAALEERMRADSELADAFAELTETTRSESTYGGGFDVASRRWSQRLSSIFRRGKKERVFSEDEFDGPAANEEDVSSDASLSAPPQSEDLSKTTDLNAGAVVDKSVSPLNRRRTRRFEFIPKIVSVPRRLDSDGLIFKRATELSTDKTSRSEAGKRSSRSARSLFSRRREDVRLSFAVSDVDFSKTVDARIPRTGTVSSVGALNDVEDAFFCSSNSRRFDAPSIAVAKTIAHTTGRLRSIDVSKEKSSVFTLRGRSADESELYLAQRGSKFVPFQVSTDKSASIEGVGVFSDSSAFHLVPFEYNAGESAYRQSAPSARAFNDAGISAFDFVRTGYGERTARRADMGAPFFSGEEYVVPKFGTVLLGGTGISYSVKLDDEDQEVGPTLSAEESYLAELLGHIPTTVELDEFYWEEVDEREKQERSSFGSAFFKALTFVTEPPVLVGRFTINAFRACTPRGFSRGEDYKQTKNNKGNDKSYVSDMMVSTIAGVLIAVCFVFPGLRYLVNELYMTVAESRVRKIGENVVLTQHETEEALIPVTEGLHHVFYPQYSPDQSSGNDDVMMNW